MSRQEDFVALDERVLPAVTVKLSGAENSDAKAFATALRLAAQRHKTLARATDGDTGRPVSRNSALSFTVQVTWYDAPAQGIRVTLSHDGENVPMPTRFFSEKATRWTSTSSIRPPYFSSSVSRQRGQRSPSI